jgi:multicomponent Na+:H+ antiporter subunit B
MTGRGRGVVFALGALLLGTVLVTALMDLPGSGADRGGYGDLLATIGYEERAAVNSVSAVLFDLRPSDTLGEALALFVASAGLQLVLRGLAGEDRRRLPRVAVAGRRAPVTSDAVRTLALGLVTPLAAFAIFVSLRGHLSVGGGLQGGALASSALATIFLAGRYRAQRRIAPEEHLDHAEAVSIGGYTVVGLAGLVVGGAFLENILPVGVTGALLSSGTIQLLSLLVAIEAAAAVVLVLTEIQEEPLEREGEA